MTRNELEATALLLGFSRKDPYWSTLWSKDDRVALNPRATMLIVVVFYPLKIRFETEDPQEAFDKLMEFLTQEPLYNGRTTW